jgi:hypothetical protein
MVLARSRSKFKDGIFFVDLENGSHPIVRKISDSIRSANPEPTKESLIEDLTNKKCLIVFNDSSVFDKMQGQKNLVT